MAFCVPVKREKAKRWRIMETETGRGVYGSVRMACKRLKDDEDCSYVIKIIPFRRGYSKKSFLREVRAQQILASKGLALDVVDFWTCKEKPLGVIVMKVLNMTAEKFLTEIPSTLDDQRKLIKEISNLVKDLHHAGYYHGDLHLGNIMLKNVEKDQPYTFNSSLGKFRVYLVDMGKTGSLKHPGKLFGKPLTAQKRIDTDLRYLESEFKAYARKALSQQ